MKFSSNLTLVALALLCSYSFAASNTCRAVVLQSGGDLGAYEAGVLLGLVKNAQDETDFQYNVVTGVSIGAINGIAMAQYPIGQELDMVNFLNDTWHNVKQSEIYKSWPLGYAQGLVSRSLLNNEPEQSYIESKLHSSPNARKIVVVSTDVHTAQRVTFSEQSWGTDKTLAAQAGVYSSAIPGFFKYRELGNLTLVDGGVLQSVDIEDAVYRCREEVSDDSNIVVDIVYCTNSTLIENSKDSYTGYEMFFRGQAIHSASRSYSLYDYARHLFPEVNWRYVVVPSQKLQTQSLPVKFDMAISDEYIKIGYNDAISAMNEGAGANADRVWESFRQYDDDLFYSRQSVGIHD